MKLLSARVQLTMLCLLFAACDPETEPEDPVSVAIYPTGELISKGIGPEFIDEVRNEFYFRGGDYNNIRSFNWKTKIDSVIFPGYVESTIYLAAYVPSTEKLYFTNRTKNSVGFYELDVSTLKYFNRPYLNDMNPELAFADEQRVIYTQLSDSLFVYEGDFKGHKRRLHVRGALMLKLEESPEIVVHNPFDRTLNLYNYELDKITFQSNEFDAPYKFYESSLGILYQTGDRNSDTFVLQRLEDNAVVHQISQQKNPKYYFNPKCLNVFYQVIHPVGYNYNRTKIHCEHILTKEHSTPIEIDNGSYNYMYQFDFCNAFLLGAGSGLYLVPIN